jgi:ribonuclease HI
VPWDRRYFKGNKVYARVDEAGELVVDDGRVEMKYNEDEDAKVYRANPRNMSGPLDENGQPKGKAKRSKGTKSADHQIQPTEAPMVSTDVPDELASYPMPDDGIVEVYTDGACSGNPGPCGYGLLMRDGFNYRELNQYLGTGTNNIAELTAIKVALENVEDRSRPVRIYTDSSYSIGVLTKGWKAKANRELILEIRDLISKFDDVDLIKVKGHSGHPLNERADTLATATLDDHR